MRSSADALRSIKRYCAHVLGDEWEVRLWEDEGTFKRPFARVARAGPVLPTPRGKVALDIVLPVVVHLYQEPQQTVEAGVALAEAAEEKLMDGIEIGVSYTETLLPPQLVASLVAGTGGFTPGDYTYAVTASNTAGETTRSVPASVTVAGSDHVFLEWSPVGGASSYRVYRGADADSLGLIGSYSVPPADAELPYTGLVILDDATATPGASPPTTNGATVTRQGAPRRIPLYDHAEVPWIGAESDTTARFEHDYLRVVDLSFNRLHDPTDERLISGVADLRVTWRRRSRVPSGTNLVNAVRVTEFHD